MSCIACDLSSGRVDLPGGRIHATRFWIVEHCVGPLGLGALIVKPERHCLRVSELTEEESAELGPLLAHTAGVVDELLSPSQVYVSLWSHQDWVPGHIHFVVQPIGQELKEKFPVPGPLLQVQLFAEGVMPEREEVDALCDEARRAFVRPRASPG